MTRESGRCNWACPHGDRCALEDGHSGGCTHRQCACNEANTLLADLHAEHRRLYNRVLTAWLHDRREQYTTSDRMQAFIDELQTELKADEPWERHRHGELDDLMDKEADPVRQALEEVAVMTKPETIAAIDATEAPEPVKAQARRWVERTPWEVLGVSRVTGPEGVQLRYGWESYVDIHACGVTCEIAMSLTDDLADAVLNDPVRDALEAVAEAARHAAFRMLEHDHPAGNVLIDALAPLDDLRRKGGE